MVRALNLGCGNDYRESTEDINWVNVDQGECRADFHFDIEGKWPYLGDGTEHGLWFDRIDAIQVLEHINRENFFYVISQMYEMSRDGAIWNIAVPHGFSDNFITDPTHKMPFSTRTFDYFIDGTPLRENGLIYGWGDITLEHVRPPEIDGNHSIIFTLRVCKSQKAP